MADGKPGGGHVSPRPLSPHLEVYTFAINMAMSIFHRITGVALYLGSLLLVGWLTSAAIGPEAFDCVNGWLSTYAGRFVLFLYTWALFHHGLGGIRHFIWDTGKGFDPKMIDNLSWGTLLGSVLLTAIVWIYVAGQKGWHP